MEALLAAGAEPNSGDEEGATALHKVRLVVFSRFAHMCFVIVLYDLSFIVLFSVTNYFYYSFFYFMILFYFYSRMYFV